MEREYGQFRRVLALPARVKAGKAEARVENGVLKVVLPKSGEDRKRKIKIKK